MKLIEYFSLRKLKYKPLYSPLKAKRHQHPYIYPMFNKIKEFLRPFFPAGHTAGRPPNPPPQAPPRPSSGRIVPTRPCPPPPKLSKSIQPLPFPVDYEEKKSEPVLELWIQSK